MILLIAMFPFWWMINTSLKQQADIFGGVTLYPHNPTTANYSRLFNTYHFADYLQNSILIVTVSVAVSLVLGTLAAYPLARFHLRFGLNQSALVVALLVRMLPPILLVIPFYIMLGKWGLLNTRMGLILIYSCLNTSFVIWMMQSFLAEIPREIEEAAMVDGDSRLTALRRVVLPLAGAGPRGHRHLQRDRHLQRLPAGAVADLDAGRPDGAGRRLHADRQDPDRVRADGGGGRGGGDPDRDLRVAGAAPLRARPDAGRGQVSGRRLTTGQALVAFLAAQQVERDGATAPLFAGVLGIFGHGNVAGIGQALQQDGRLRYVLPRNEQAMVHTAVAYAKQRHRLQTWACTSSIGPGATNMVTGAALATINRLPVLLLPGDVFASRRPNPVLQQLELPGRPEASVNDTLAPVSRFFDRVNRPDQLPSSLLEAMRVLTDQAETGAVTIALPQDVQAEAADFPDQLFAPRVWHVARPGAAAEPLAAAVALLREARRPLIVAGGGLRYSQAGDALRALVDATGMPVAETQAGKGALPFDHPSALGALGATGTAGANLAAREADVVLAVGTRLSDFTTASHTAFQDPGLRLIALNVSGFDAHKLGALPLVADARAGLEQLAAALSGYRVAAGHAELTARRNREWDAEVERLTAPAAGPPTQAQVIGAVNAGRADDVVVCAAGSLPGDLHKLWRTRDTDGYHLEYGYSCMGYEVAGGLGVKLAAPDREVIVMVGDGSWLMMSSEIATSIQEDARITVVLIDNKGFGSIGALSRSLGSEGFGTRYTVSVDLVQNAASLGAIATRAETLDELTAALDAARNADRTSVIVIACDPGTGGRLLRVVVGRAGGGGLGDDGSAGGARGLRAVARSQRPFLGGST